MLWSGKFPQIPDICPEYSSELANKFKKTCDSQGNGNYYSSKSLIFGESLCYRVHLLLIWATAAAAAKSRQSCPTLCDPIDSRPPGSAVPGILQARTLERVAIAFSNAWKWKVKAKLLSSVRLLATPWTAAHQAPPSTGFSRQEYWSGVPLPSPNLGYLGPAQFLRL